MTQAPGQAGGLAIVAGSGVLAREVAESAAASGSPVFIVGLADAVDPGWIERFPHIVLGLGQVATLIRTLRERGIGKMLFIGGLVRPDLSSIRPELSSLKYLPDFVKFFRGGDDHLLAGIVKFFEAKGFEVVGPADVARELVCGAGRLGRQELPKDAPDAIGLASRFLQATSPFDVGQSVVVAARQILAVEAAEGTNAMIERVGSLRASGRIKLRPGIGILVKAPKRGQDLRIDMPAIGPQTIEMAAQAGLAGIAAAKGEVLLAERTATLAAADAAGLFVFGYDLAEDQRLAEP